MQPALKKPVALFSETYAVSENNKFFFSFQLVAVFSTFIST